MNAALTLLATVAFFMWAVLGHSTPAERQQTVDASCPTHPVQVRYPEGFRTAVCNPTLQTWRN